MLEAGENPSEALSRELTEEMGFVPCTTKLYPFDVYRSADKKFMHYTFISVVDEEFIPILNKESSGYAWIELGIWPKPMHYGTRVSLCTPKSIEKLNMILEQHI